MLREAARAFPAGKGFNGFCARWFLFLSDEVLLDVCRLLLACERAGIWPEALQHVLLHLIPKKGGGKRPIGLVNGLCRLWELVRRPLVRAWRAAQGRKYDYGARGRSSTDAVWLQALYDEAAEFSEEAAATALLDLTKAFESVPLELIWARGNEMGFPPGILRLSLEMCAFVRHLVLEGVLGEGTETLSAILAGTSFATDLLFIVMTMPCDRLLERWPRANLSLVVDDMAIQLVGEKGEVAEGILAAVDQAVGELTDIGCMVSLGDAWAPEGKTIVVSSSQQVLGRIRLGLKARGMHAAKHAKHLGVDYHPGRRGQRLRKVAAKRLREAGVRKDYIRQRRLPGKAVNRIVRTALIPAAVHGAKVLGVTDAELSKLTSLSHAAFGRATGKSAYARLSLSGGMPGARQAIEPIVAWSTAVFDQTVPEPVLQEAWRNAAARVGLSSSPFDQVSGPASATAAAARRLGWQMVGATALREPTGHLLDLRKEAPETIKKAALEAFDDWSAKRSSLAVQIGGPPFLEPLRAYCDRKSTSAAVKGSLRSMAEGGWPTQASLYAAGLSDSPLCQLCQSSPGTFYHRVRACRGTQHLRKGAWATRAGLCSAGVGTAEETATPLFRRGVAVAPPRAPLLNSFTASRWETRR